MKELCVEQSLHDRRYKVGRVVRVVFSWPSGLRQTAESTGYIDCLHGLRDLFHDQRFRGTECQLVCPGGVVFVENTP